MEQGDKVATLVEMMGGGIDAESAREVLQVNDWNLEAAMNMILGDGTPGAPASRPARREELVDAEGYRAPMRTGYNDTLMAPISPIEEERRRQEAELERKRQEEELARQAELRRIAAERAREEAQARQVAEQRQEAERLAVERRRRADAERLAASPSVGGSTTAEPSGGPSGSPSSAEPSRAPSGSPAPGGSSFFFQERPAVEDSDGDDVEEEEPGLRQGFLGFGLMPPPVSSPSPPEPEPKCGGDEARPKAEEEGEAVEEEEEVPQPAASASQPPCNSEPGQQPAVPSSAEVAPESPRVAAGEAGIDSPGPAARRSRELDPVTQACVALKRRYTETDPSGLSTCLETLRAYINNLAKSPHEQKFQRINCSNAAFQGRVASFEGAVDVLLACGFTDDGGVLQFGASSAARAKLWDALAKVDVMLSQLKGAAPQAAPPPQQAPPTPAAGAGAGAGGRDEEAS